MRLGLGAMNYGTCADPDVAVRVAQAAEAAGFESLWTAEHAVLPHPMPEGFHLPSDLPWLDPIASLSLLAAITDTIKVATGTVEVPLHHPVRLAKQLASLDVISKGRLITAFGLGYLDAEFETLGIPKAGRGERMDEYLDVLHEMWTGDPPRYSGTTVTVSGVDAHPRPVQPGGPPLILGGGSTERARRRIIERAQGWYLFNVDAVATAEAIETIGREIERHERPSELGPIQMTVTPAELIDASVIRRYEDLGVHRLVLLPGSADSAAGEHGARRTVCAAESDILRTIERGQSSISS